MRKARIGDQVHVHFVGTLDDGSEFSNSYLVEEPFEFVIGSSDMLPAFERAVLELAPGEETRIRIPVADAYGAYDESLIEVVPVRGFPAAHLLPVGEFIEIPTADGEIRAKVLKIEDGNIYFDRNHELAGKDLNFTIKLVDIIE